MQQDNATLCHILYYSAAIINPWPDVFNGPLFHRVLQILLQIEWDSGLGSSPDIRRVRSWLLSLTLRFATDPEIPCAITLTSPPIVDPSFLSTHFRCHCLIWLHTATIGRASCNHGAIDTALGKTESTAIKKDMWQKIYSLQNTSRHVGEAFDMKKRRPRVHTQSTRVNETVYTKACQQCWFSWN